MAVNDKRFRWDYAAAGKLLLKSEEMAEFVEEQAQRMTRATGMEYKPEIKRTSERVFAMAKDHMKSEHGYYKTRKKGKGLVYTERKLKAEKLKGRG